MNKFSLDNLDKSTWEPYRFQEIAERISITVDPTTTELEIYVGLEHIDAEDIHIRRFGKPSDVKGNKLKCFKGDVIFGKRRAYQRKAAIVEFDGICSAHSFVFRAKPNIIEPKLFPFFLHSDQFMHRAVDISVGGLSPTINWGDLKDEEFLLPPKEEQKKLAELLWAMDDVIEKEKMVFVKLSLQKTLLIKNFIAQYKKGKRINLGDVCRPRQWATISSGEILNEGYLVYGANGIIGRYHTFNHKEPVIAICCRGAYCGSIHLTQPESYVTGNAMCLDDLDEGIFLTKFLYYILRDSSFNGVITGSAQPQIVREDLDKFKLYEIALDEQKSIIRAMDQLDESSTILSKKISDSNSLKKSLINQIF